MANLVTEGIVSKIINIDLSIEDYDNSINKFQSIIFCVADGDVAIEAWNGVDCTPIPMVAGQYWKFNPKTIYKVGTTATVQLHS